MLDSMKRTVGTAVGLATLCCALAGNASAADPEAPAPGLPAPTQAQLHAPAVNASPALPAEFAPLAGKTGLTVFPGNKITIGGSAAGTKHVAPSQLTYSPTSSVLSGSGAGSRLAGTAKPASADLIVCEVNAEITPGDGRYAVHGEHVCSAPVDLLGVNVCADIWAVGGYWSELQCSAYGTSSGDYEAQAPGFGRNCTYDRIYRARANGYVYSDEGADNATGYSNEIICGG